MCSASAFCLNVLATPPQAPRLEGPRAGKPATQQDKLCKLEELHERGNLSSAEFGAARRRLERAAPHLPGLDDSPDDPSPGAPHAASSATTTRSSSDPGARSKPGFSDGLQAAARPPVRPATAAAAALAQLGEDLQRLMGVHREQAAAAANAASGGVGASAARRSAARQTVLRATVRPRPGRRTSRTFGSRRPSICDWCKFVQPRCLQKCP
jgi:hypothetical protein